MIDLTPLDVRNKRGDFRKAMRGYEPQEVDLFLELVAERLEALVRETMQLRERVQTLQTQVSASTGREQAVQDALVTAQELRADIRAQSQREAEHALREAEIEARRLVSEADEVVRERLRGIERQVDDAGRAVDELERRRTRFLQEFKNLLERELDVVHVEEGRVPLEHRAIDLDLGPSRGPERPDHAPTEPLVPLGGVSGAIASSSDPVPDRGASDDVESSHDASDSGQTATTQVRYPAGPEEPGIWPVDVEALRPLDAGDADAELSPPPAELAQPDAELPKLDAGFQRPGAELTQPDAAPRQRDAGTPRPGDTLSRPEATDARVVEGELPETRRVDARLPDTRQLDAQLPDGRTLDASPSDDGGRPPEQDGHLPPGDGPTSGTVDVSELGPRAGRARPSAPPPDVSSEPSALELELMAGASREMALPRTRMPVRDDEFAGVPDLETVLAEAGAEEVNPPAPEEIAPPPVEPDDPILLFDPDVEDPFRR